jgi:Ca2+-binding RTX toxin-like protein
LGAYLSKLVYTSYTIADYFSPDNTINAYTSSVIDLVVSYASGTTSLTGNLDGRSVISTSTTVDTSSIVKMSIGSELNASATENLVWNGQMGDSIWLGYAASTAARQEIQTYLAVKYATMGVVVNATSALAAASVGTSVTGYDLSNNNSSVLIDQVLDTSAAGAVRDVVLTGGPDVVNVGAGDDTVYLHDLSFRQIDGGKGNDTLVLAADYAGSSALVLSDFVSNARANTNGWHKLWGFENLDASLSASKQLLTVTAADINQLSETNTFAVTLGSNDVIKPYTGLTGVVQLGLWTVNGSYYDRFWSGTDSGQTINLYAKSGVLAPGLTSATLNTTTSVTVVMDQAVDTTSVVAQADFSIETGGTTVTGITSTPASNQLSLTLGTAVSGGILGLSYTASGNGWMSTDGVKVSFTKWYIGDASGNTIDRSSETSARLVLMGNLGDDVIQGGAKSDLIVGGVGNDTLTGNGGGDVFRWDLGNTGTDTITDFNAAKSDVGALGTADRLDLRGVLSTTGLTATNLTANLANYVSLVRGGPGVVSSSSTTLNDAVLKVDINADGTAEQSIVLQSAWTSLQGMTDVSGAAIGSGSPTSSQMLMELVQRGQLMVV